jgi:hypothetical protein
VNLEDKLECHNQEIDNQEAIFGRLFQLDWFDHQTTRRAPLKFLDFCFLYIHLLLTTTRSPSLFDTFVTVAMSSTPPPSKQSMDKVAEMLSSIQQQMHLLNPPEEAGEGLQLDFTAAAEQYPFSLGNPSPSLGFGMGMGMAAAATEKEVVASGLLGGMPRCLMLCHWCCFLRRMNEIIVVDFLEEIGCA